MSENEIRTLRPESRWFHFPSKKSPPSDEKKESIPRTVLKRNIVAPPLGYKFVSEDLTFT
jgi:hypothetical protein